MTLSKYEQHGIFSGASKEGMKAYYKKTKARRAGVRKLEAKQPLPLGLQTQIRDTRTGFSNGMPRKCVMYTKQGGGILIKVPKGKGNFKTRTGKLKDNLLLVQSFRPATQAEIKKVLIQNGSYTKREIDLNSIDVGGAATFSNKKADQLTNSDLLKYKTSLIKDELDQKMGEHMKALAANKPKSKRRSSWVKPQRLR